MDFYHIPVMLGSCIDALNILPNGIYVDGTAGGAGHSVEIAKRLGQEGRLIAIDKDPIAIETASQRLLPYKQAVAVQGDFSNLPSILDSLNIGKVNGILLDLGVSSHQLDNVERGFSYHNDAPLDMRMSSTGQSAGEMLNTLSVQELTTIFKRYGEEKFSFRIASNIVAARQDKPLQTTLELVEIIKQSIPAPARRKGGHPAKRVFQAIRIAVNGELDSLATCLDTAFSRLESQGRFAIITFHSLEDRMVKRAFVGYCTGCTCPPDFPICVCGKTPKAKLAYRKPVLASEQELADNSRAKSAKLRALEKI